MKLAAIKYCLIFIALLFFSNPMQADDYATLPKSVGFVNDFAGVLDADSKAKLELKLKSYFDSTSTQIAVVIEKSLSSGDDIDARTLRFAREWKVGSKENNNGLVLYFAMDDHKYKLLTSQSTQGALPDGLVGQIGRTFIVPNLRKGKIYDAIDQATTAYMQALAGEFSGLKKGKENVPGWVFFLVIFGMIFFIGILNNSKYGRGYKSGGAYWIPGGGWGRGGGWGGGSSSGGGGWGGFGGGGGFDGGGAGGSW